MTREQKRKKLFNAYNAYRLIETEEALKRNKLSLSDYHEVFRIISELNYNPECVQTVCRNAAEWLKRYGFNIHNLYGYYGVTFE